MKQLLSLVVAAVCAACLSGCERPRNVTDRNELPPIYPDYTNVTIPVNIAPLNFIFRQDIRRADLEIQGKYSSFTLYEDNKVQFSLPKWKAFMEKEAGERVTVRVTAKVGKEWIRYAPFYWEISPDSIDSYLSCHLTGSGYDPRDGIQLCERNLETFDERVLADNNLTEGSYINYHTYCNRDESRSMFHLQGAGREETVLNRNGTLRKLNINAGGRIFPAIYGAFHPSGKYAVFSTNTITPDLHALQSKGREVYDTGSDLVVIDFDTNNVFSSPLLSGKSSLETFPAFSADGKTIYFCSASAVALPDSIENLKYSLCSIAFDEVNGRFGAKIDTLINAREHNKSICYPKVSPDGRYLLYTIVDCGVSPARNQKTDLQLIDLYTGTTDSLTVVNSDRSDTHHSWSSNNRWIVFASKRDDGMYGKPYFSYMDAAGKTHKPFVLPQRDPSGYDYLLKSFSVPELSKGKVPFNAIAIEKLYKNSEAETVSNR